jgi:hypothetical protein
LACTALRTAVYTGTLVMDESAMILTEILQLTQELVGSFPDPLSHLDDIDGRCVSVELFKRECLRLCENPGGGRNAVDVQDRNGFVFSPSGALEATGAVGGDAQQTL